MSFHFYVFEYASLTNMDVFLPNTPNEVDSSWSHLMLSLKSKPWVSNTARKLWRGSPRPAWWLCPSRSSVSSIRFFSTFAAGSRCHCAFRKWPFASPSPRGDSCGPLSPALPEGGSCFPEAKLRARLRVSPPPGALGAWLPPPVTPRLTGRVGDDSLALPLPSSPPAPTPDFHPLGRFLSRCFDRGLRSGDSLFPSLLRRGERHVRGCGGALTPRRAAEGEMEGGEWGGGHRLQTTQ